MHRKHLVNRCLSNFGQSACSASEYVHPSYYDIRWELEYTVWASNTISSGDLYLIKIKLLKGPGVWCQRDCKCSLGHQKKINIWLMFNSQRNYQLQTCLHEG